MKRRTPALRPVAAAVQLAWWTASAMAGPQGGSVAAGQATIAQQGGATHVTQASPRAVLNWQSFSVGASESVVFSQPNASAAILNRVTGNDLSQIFGSIRANGQVYLVNPNGVLFGRTARVDVGSLLATTSNIADGDFMVGRLRFDQPGRPGAAVRNEGRITVAQGGFAALVAPGVGNAGVIDARLGKVSLAAGDAFVLDLYGDALVNLVVDAASMRALTDAQGRPLSAFVDNSGSITADGGRVQLAVTTVKQLIDNAINVSGSVRATTVGEHAGVISLRGDGTTRVAVGGTLVADGTRGGSIEVTGRDVVLAASSHVSVSGTQGGGSVSIGGHWQGRGTLAHASGVSIEPGARIEASAIDRGDGGTVAVWSDGRTRFDGDIAARAGAAGGRGGDVEVSSRGQLGFFGSVDVASPSGRHGSLLLDPLDLTIGAATSGDSNIAAAQIGLLLSRGVNVQLEASRNLVVDRPIDGRGGVAGAGLGLTAGNDLSVNQLVLLNGGSLSLTAGGALRLGEAGGIRVSGVGAGVTLNAHSDIELDADVQAQSGTIALTSTHGAVTARVAQAGGPLAAADAALDAGGDAELSRIVVRAAGPVTLGEMRAHHSIDIESTASNVRLLKTLGGSGTGYRNFADGYQQQERPNVGRLLVSAPLGSVELNGLNIDGNASPFTDDDGLRATAGRIVLSNDTIAVNKGHTVLRGGSGQPNHGVYLGGSVFSRGWDSVGADGVRGTADDVKIGYRVGIHGATLGLFDNTTEFASLPGIHAVTLTSGAVVHTDMQGYVIDASGAHVTPLQRVHASASDVRVVAVDATGNFANAADATLGFGTCAVTPGVCPVLGVPVFRNVAKIEIANNVANYRDTVAAGGLTPEVLQSLLVPSTNNPASNTITIAATTIAGVAGTGPSSDAPGAGRIDLASFGDPARTPMSQTLVATTASEGAVASPRGIALKLLGFEVTGDHSTVVWSNSIDFGSVGVSPPALPSPDGVPGSNGFFGNPDNFEPGTTIAAPLNGLFDVRLLTFASRNFTRNGVQETEDLGLVSTVYTLRQLPGQLSGYAQVIGVQVADPALREPPAGGTNVVWNFGIPGREGSPFSAYTSIRFDSAPNIGRPGQAAAMTITGSLFSQGGAPLLANGALRSPGLTAVPTPNVRQTASGTLVSAELLSGNPGAGFVLAGAVSDSSASGAFGQGQTGTRLFVFDGGIDTQAGKANGDVPAGVWLPNFRGVGGTNNSTTGRDAVGPSFGTLLGASGNVAIGAASERAGRDAGVAPANVAQRELRLCDEVRDADARDCKPK
jgi:filamentous hemagglutinin family protein